MKHLQSHDHLSGEWIACDNPEVTDVIRWVEPIWSPQKKVRGKPDQIGEQQVTAELIKIGEFFDLLVIEVEQIVTGTKPPLRELAVKAGDRVHRKEVSVVERGKCERQLWIDEEARTFFLETEIYKGKKKR